MIKFKIYFLELWNIIGSKITGLASTSKIKPWLGWYYPNFQDFSKNLPIFRFSENQEVMTFYEDAKFKFWQTFIPAIVATPIPKASPEPVELEFKTNVSDFQGKNWRYKVLVNFSTLNCPLQVFQHLWILLPRLTLLTIGLISCLQLKLPCKRYFENNFLKFQWFFVRFLPNSTTKPNLSTLKTSTSSLIIWSKLFGGSTPLGTNTTVWRYMEIENSGCKILSIFSLSETIKMSTLIWSLPNKPKSKLWKPCKKAMSHWIWLSMVKAWPIFNLNSMEMLR